MDHVQATYQACLSSLHEMLGFIKEYAQNMGYDQKKIAQIELAAEEALVNIIHYAYPSDKQGTILINCSVKKEQQLIITIKDDGIPFDPIADSKGVDIEAPLEERACGGYGIHIIRTVMDDVHYQREDGHNILTLMMQC